MDSNSSLSHSITGWQCSPRTPHPVSMCWFCLERIGWVLLAHYLIWIWEVRVALTKDIGWAVWREEPYEQWSLGQKVWTEPDGAHLVMCSTQEEYWACRAPLISVVLCVRAAGWLHVTYLQDQGLHYFIVSFSINKWNPRKGLSLDSTQRVFADKGICWQISTK